MRQCAKLVRQTRLFILMIFMVATVIGYAYAPEPMQDRMSLRLPELGTDNGFALALFYGSDIDGSLETCG
ncbi:MAG: hypothetical protein RMM98_08600 [Acidobacteriota bacterium]|nr:hypothetical protein [Blastocatellia bacterium]MDW8239662.1 hypothetical protein [Acidobacteriota bacterium]